MFCLVTFDIVLQRQALTSILFHVTYKEMLNKHCRHFAGSSNWIVFRFYRLRRTKVVFYLIGNCFVQFLFHQRSCVSYSSLMYSFYWWHYLTGNKTRQCRHKCDSSRNCSLLEGYFVSPSILGWNIS